MTNFVIDDHQDTSGTANISVTLTLEHATTGQDPEFSETVTWQTSLTIRQSL